MGGPLIGEMLAKVGRFRDRGPNRARPSDISMAVIVVCIKPIPAKTVGNPPEFSARLKLSVKPYCAGASRLGKGSYSMLQRVIMPGLFAAMLFSAPAFAITAQEKMKTCEFGAEDQKLTGAARKTFMSKCMANGDAPG